MKPWSIAYALGLLACNGEQRDPAPAAAGHAGISSTAGAASAAGQAGAPLGRGGDGGDENGGGGSSGAAGADSCAEPNLGGLSVVGGAWDPLGYPPYAVEGCQLVYVKGGLEAGGLYRRDLVTATETLLEPATANPSRPAIAADVVAWQVDVDGKSQVRVLYAGESRTLSGAFDHAGEPRVTVDGVVFTGFLTPDADGDTDVFFYEPSTATLKAVAPGPGQQRFADVSHDYVAFTDFAEDPNGHFDERESIANLALFERATGKLSVRQREGKQAFPLLASDGALVYLDWSAVHPEPKFSQFSLRGGRVTDAVERDVDLVGAPVHTNPAYVRPSLRGPYVDFVDSQNGVASLYRVTLGASSAPAAVPIAGSPELLGPIATPAFTLIATRSLDQTGVMLRSIQR